MKKLYKWAALGLLWVWVLGLFSPALAAQEAESPQVLEIGTAEELLALAQSCTLDSYSAGLTVYLTADIDLTGTGFTSIPIFCGSFQGQGHTISGLSITGDGSHMGLIRYLEPGACIADLTVTGTVSPGGSAGIVGGIVGQNQGTVENCVFSGTVSGQELIGGLVGVNESQGLISGCENQAAVSGTAYVGGIAGRNLGTITGCQNRGEVNTVYIQGSVGLSLPDLSVDRADLGVVADVGGIAGQSTGVIVSCENTGTVGCASTGYNIGGIVGRQSGYVAQCQNSGTVLGRKDVGGIVGQAEPHISLDMDGAVLPTLTQELDTLHDLVNDTLTDAKSASSAISAGFSAVGAYTYAAAQDAASLTRQVQAGVSTLVTDWNQYRESLSGLRDSAGLFISDWADTSQELTQKIQAWLDSMEVPALPTPEPTAQPESTAAPTDTPEPVPEPTAALQEDTAFTDDDAVAPTPEETDLESPLPELEAPDLQSQSDTADLILPEAESAPSPQDDSATTAELPAQALAALTQLQDSAAALQSHTQTLTSDMDALKAWLSQDDPDEAQIATLTAALAAHVSAASTALAPVMAQITALNTALAPYTQDMDEQTQLLWQAIQAAGAQLDLLVTDAKALLDKMEALPEITLPDTGNSAQTLDSMFQNLSGLGSCLSALNTTVTAGTGSLVDDLTAVNDQFNLVMQLVVQSLSGEETLDINLLTDQSDLDTEKPSCGKLYQCVNLGAIQGDLDVGGIAGDMGIEYDFDLEGDIFGTDGLNLSASYLTKCVVRSCENQGAVTARKNNAGGIVGLMEQGTGWACQSYGPVTSSDGEYVGGIAGQSLGSIRDCYALCALSGSNYVGGIAGLGQGLYNNRALVSVQNAQEQAGAIAGAVAEDGVCQGNLFVDRGLGAIDGISYADQAQPIAYEELIGLEDTPAAFSALTITLQAQGEVVAQIPFAYGQSIDTASLPEPPALEGYTGVWEDFDWENLTFPATVTAVYTAYEATIATDAVRPADDSALPLLLAEGSFYPEAALTADTTEDAPALGTNETFLEAWHIAVTGAVDETGPFVLHYRLPDTKGTVALYLRQEDGAWSPIAYATEGQYAIFSLSSAQADLCALSVPSPQWPLWLGIGLGAALIAGALVIPLRRRRRRTGAHLQE